MITYAGAGPGRPSHTPSLRSKRRVARLRMGGATVRELAKALGVSAPTLRKHYAHELAFYEPGAIRFRALMGSRVALRHLRAMNQATAQIAAESASARPGPEADLAAPDVRRLRRLGLWGMDHGPDAKR